jgi:hypothetical protein
VFEDGTFRGRLGHVGCHNLDSDMPKDPIDPSASGVLPATSRLAMALLLIKPEPDRRERTRTKLADNLVPTILKRVPNMDGVKIAGAIGFDPLSRCRDRVEAILRSVGRKCGGGSWRGTHLARRPTKLDVCCRHAAKQDGPNRHTV